MINSKQYDLEERTLRFAKAVRDFIKVLPKSIANIEDAKQLIRSSGSVGANYIEANEALGRKDFFLRARIARKEAKESRFWLELINTNNYTEFENKRKELLKEVTELLKILSSLHSRSDRNPLVI